MAIRVTCGACRAEFRAKDEHAGKKGKCPKCSEPITVPSRPVAVVFEPNPNRMAASIGTAAKPQNAAAPENVVAAPQGPKGRQKVQAEILASLNGQIERVRVSWTYSFAAFLVAIVMVLLPIIYLALIVLVAYGMYYHAVYDTGMLSMARGGRAQIMLLLAYLAPLAAGGILVFFMFKPLLARPEKVDRRRSLTRQSEPLLFAFVEQICTLVGSPLPRRIDVNCEVNASASFRRGWLSLLMPADLVVTIGMPLVAGLSLRQFAGHLGLLSRDSGPGVAEAVGVALARRVACQSRLRTIPAGPFTFVQANQATSSGMNENCQFAEAPWERRSIARPISFSP